MLNRFKNFSQKPHYVFALVASICIIISSLITPLFKVNDEEPHFIRSYEMSNFSLAKNICNIPEQVASRSSSGKIDKEIEHTCYTASNYNPILHLPQSIGIFFTKLITNDLALIIIGGRIANSIAYITILTLLIRFIRKESYVWFVVAISLIPMSLHSAGSLSGDSMNNAIIIAFISIVFKYILNQKILSKKDLFIISIISILILSTKVTYTPLITLLALIPKSSFNFINKYSNRLNKYLILSLIVSISAIPSLLWHSYAKDSSAITTPNYGILSNASNPLEYTKIFLKITYNTYLNPFTNSGHGDYVLQGVTDKLGGNTYSMPDIIILVLWIVIFITLIIKVPNGLYRISQKRLLLISIYSVALFAMLVLAITYVLYTMWTARVMGESIDYAFGIQGRYFTAIITLFIPLGVYVSRYIMSSNFNGKITVGFIVLSTFSLAAMFYLYQTYAWSVLYYLNQ